MPGYVTSIPLTLPVLIQYVQLRELVDANQVGGFSNVEVVFIRILFL
jgi:hypothetical protein